MTMFNNIISWYRNRSLRIAAWKGRDAEIIKLVRNGAKINSKNIWGRAALTYAASTGHKTTASILIANGANPNIKNKDGVTPLMYAAGKHHLEVVQLLLDSGAEINDRSNHGMTALMFAIYYAYQDHHADVVDLLLQRGADVRIVNDFGTTAEVMARLRLEKISRLLIIYSGIEKPSALDQKKARDVEISRAYAYFYKKHGSELLENSKHDEAIVDFNKSLTINPCDFEVYNKRGESYLFNKDYNRAIQDFNESINLSPNNSSTFIVRGFAYLYSGQLDNAVKDANKAISLNCCKSDLTRAYSILGEIFYIKKQYDEAIKIYDKYIDIEPDADAYHRRGNAHAAIGQFGNAINDYNRAFTFPAIMSPALYNDRGHAYDSLGDKLNANADFEEAQRLITRCGNAEVFDRKNCKKTILSKQ